MGAGAKAAADTISDARMSFMFRMMQFRIYVCVRFKTERERRARGKGKFPKKMKRRRKEKELFRAFLEEDDKLDVWVLIFYFHLFLELLRRLF